MISADILLTGALALSFAVTIFGLGWLSERPRRPRDHHGVAAE